MPNNNATTRSHSDGWVNEDEPYKNHGKGNRLWLRSGDSGHARRSFISFARTWPRNDAVQIVTATLRVFARGGWSGTHTVTAKRVVESWRENRVNFHNQPDVVATSLATVSAVHPADGEELDIDVTDMLQDVVNGNHGGDFYGFQLTIDDDAVHTLYSSDAGREVYHPRLYVEWALPPYPPTELQPSAGGVIGVNTPKLTWRFSNPGDPQQQIASQVQISSSTDFSAPAYDSLKQTNDAHNWATAGETTIPDDSTRYWRVRVWAEGMDAHPSAWSDTAKFERHSKGTLSFVNPGPSHTVDDLTPTIEWSFTGRTQDLAELILYQIHPSSGTTEEIWRNEMSKNNLDHLTIPRLGKHPMIKSGKSYRLHLKVWDTFDRVGLPNDPAYVLATIDFTYVRSGDPDPVDTLSASQFTVSGEASPGVFLEWSRAATPDSFTIKADDVEILHEVDPTDVYAGTPGNYEAVFWEATPRDSVEYEVEAHEVGQGNSGPNPTVDLATSLIGIWLIDDDANDAVQILGDDTADLQIGESATTYNPVGNRRPVRITDAIRGYEGSFSGIITSDTKRDLFIDLKGRDKELRLIAARLNIPIWLEEIQVSPTPEPGAGVRKYIVGFSFFQSGEFPPIED